MESADEPEDHTSRTAALIVAAFVVAVLIVVAVLKVGSSSDVQVPWAIVESADEGNTLRVAPLVAITACTGEPKIDLRKSNANRVDLSVSVKDADCDTSSDGARVAAPIGVKLAQPLRGQQITGPKLQPPSAWPGTAARRGEVLPSVVGFRFPDAKAILAAYRAEIVGVVGPTADATEVTAQAPPAGPITESGASKVDVPAVRLRTVPR